MQLKACFLKRPLPLFVLLLFTPPTFSVVSPRRNTPHPSTTSTFRPRHQTEDIILFDPKACTTPQGYPGECIPIGRCPRLLEALIELNDQKTEQFLIRSRCGKRIDEVCCAFTARAPVITDSVDKPIGFSTSRPTSPATPEPTTFKAKTHKPTTHKTTTITTTTTTTEASFFEKSKNLVLSERGKCGVRQRRISDTRIVGGEPSRLGEWPWIAALGYRKTRPHQSEPRFLCGGSLITDRHILTAGHCAAQEKPYLARLGDLDLGSSEDGAFPVEISVDGAVVHPNYGANDLSNDIAIVSLKENVAFNKDIQPICLPMTPDLRSNNFVRNTHTVAGWGATYFAGPSSPEMQHVPLPVLSNEECVKAYTRVVGAKIGPGNICAGYINNKRHSACQGDSGGPLMTRVNGTFYLTGAVSFGVRCAELGYPGVFTRVTYYLDWIVENVK